MAYETQADSQPLADALNEIVEKTKCSESDPGLMLELLNDVIEIAEKGKLAYRDNVMAAQKAELEALRGQATKV